LIKSRKASFLYDEHWKPALIIFPHIFFNPYPHLITDI